MNLILEHIFSLRLVIDFGLVVLIWMVQLIVYPGFSFYQESDLLKWHKYYTPRITVVVAPLMFIQMAIAVYLSLFEFSTINLIYLLLVLSTWISTFLYFVPLHQKIEGNLDLKISSRKLATLNWIRTFQWTFIFGYSLFLLTS
ncbi:hypothetical protein LB456_10590 [Psychroflexus sp. CAK57W]|uniref:hypothetical protein n=1 Tax=Psychroflexus curvus TaxID=2873595 RepID=UPI001CCE8308|nr:hypothetical protein [Psychroflexus curvus]MBZ9628651.1 hypothetical protein [Psychroflexus curvus]MBZ9787903.1 hypothetical protein [Psychroflexus curvus]